MGEKVRSYCNSSHAAPINLVLNEVHEDPAEFLIESRVIPKYFLNEFLVNWDEAMGLEGVKLPKGALKKILVICTKEF
ncbi:MAG: hypothetical protein ACFFB3_21130 [Candidatus Hodarchaeota archaeon]